MLASSSGARSATRCRVLLGGQAHAGGSERARQRAALGVTMDDEVRYWRQQSIESRVSGVEVIREVTAGIYADEAPPDWSEFIALSIAHDVRFMIVGVHALAAIGRPRATQAIDFLVEPTLDNACRLGDALRAFGFSELANESDKFAVPPKMATLGNPPLRIDVMNAIDGVSFDEAWDGRLLARFGEHDVAFLGPEAFRKNKLAAGRPKDLADIALLDEA